MYRQEHPNPQCERENWMNLNGEWDFEFDFGKSGYDRKFFECDGFSKKINVPFCPESKLSGIEYKDFMNCVWYLRHFTLPDTWKSGRVFIHFGAVDFLTHVYVNKKEVGTHTGGYTSFSFDITRFLENGENIITVSAEDDSRSPRQATGKQCMQYASYGCNYTRTTGIWQTVWLEYRPICYVDSFRFYPSVNDCALGFAAMPIGRADFELTVSYEGRVVGGYKRENAVGEIRATVQLSEEHIWEVGHGRLYDVEIRFGDDVVKSYFGLREIAIDGMKVLINGRSVFQRLVLDQGFYRDGIYTAPTEDDLVNDIKISMGLGFNGARLHEKVFEARFLYHADRLGYLCWGEYPNWGISNNEHYMITDYVQQWKESVERDFNHPSIIGWCPFNETWADDLKLPMTEIIYSLTKSWDMTRPCIDTSGVYHIAHTDIYDTHDYEQNVEKFAGYYPDVASGNYTEHFEPHQNYNNPKYFGKPFFVSEYGGIRWAEDENAGWGYGQAPKSAEEFIERYRGLTNVLLDNKDMFGFCYTQLYDIEQEVNGLYTYDREPKFDPNIFYEINTRKAAIED